MLDLSKGVNPCSNMGGIILGRNIHSACGMYCPAQSQWCSGKFSLVGTLAWRYGHRGGGAKSLPPPPLEIKKQKKVIRANFMLFHLYFATFLVENIIFSAIF